MACGPVLWVLYQAFKIKMGVRNNIMRPNGPPGMHNPPLWIRKLKMLSGSCS